MALRIQRERMSSTHIPDEASYHRTFGITAERLRKAAPGRDRHASGPDEPRRRDRQ